jgi:hypothetical protein
LMGGSYKPESPNILKKMRKKREAAHLINWHELLPEVQKSD